MCGFFPIEDFVLHGRCGEAWQPASAVIVAGHGSPPTYLGVDVETLVAAARCFQARLVVLDTCFSATSGMLQAWADVDDAWVVAAPFFVASDGLRYAPAFFDDALPVDARAAAVRAPPLYARRASGRSTRGAQTRRYCASCGGRRRCRRVLTACARASSASRPPW